MLDSMWIEKFRPSCFNDVVLDDTTREYFDEIKASGEIPHLLFVSAPGSGKTSLAKVIVKELGLSYRYINASDERGIDAIRDKVINFAQTKDIFGKYKVLILDECDGLTPDAQRALRNVMEEYHDNVRFILTANYKNRIIGALRSRCQIFSLVPPYGACVSRVVQIIQAEGVKVSPEQKERLKSLIQSTYPDLRQTISAVQQYTIDGQLKIPEVRSETHFARKIFTMITDDQQVVDIRKVVIENEIEFNSDYLTLLKGLFEHVYDIELEEDKKRECMLTIGNYMESHQQVMDFEINAFCCLVQLMKVMN
jgi:replication factor C small subunit